jgi:hypothetical protein
MSCSLKNDLVLFERPKAYAPWRIRVTFGVCHIQTVAQIMMQYLRSAPDPENRSVINRALTGRYERGDQWEMILISAAPSRRSVRISPVNGQVIDHFAGLKLLGPSQKPTPSPVQRLTIR